MQRCFRVSDVVELLQGLTCGNIAFFLVFGNGMCHFLDRYAVFWRDLLHRFFRFFLPGEFRGWKSITVVGPACQPAALIDTAWQVGKRAPRKTDSYIFGNP
jgi:hypothetical protein